MPQKSLSPLVTGNFSYFIINCVKVDDDEVSRRKFSHAENENIFKCCYHVIENIKSETLEF